MNDPKPDNSHKKLDHELLFSQVIGIAAVVNGHYDCLNTFISIYFPYYSWHMPFFIFISGILFSRTSFKQSFSRLFWHKCKTLLIPALIINFFYGIISTVMRHYQFVLYGRDISFHNLFISPFLTNHQFENDVSLWFIFQLFSIELLTYGLYTLIKSIIRKPFCRDITIVLMTFALSMYCFNSCRLSPAKSDVQTMLFRTGFLLFFFIAGIMYEWYIRPEINRWKNPQIGCYAAIIFQAVVYFFTRSKEPGYGVHGMNIDSNMNNFQPYLNFLTAAIFILCLARYLSPLLEKSRILQFIGSNLRYVVYHHQFCGIMIGFAAMILYAAGNRTIFPKFNPISYRTKWWYCFAVSEDPFGKILYLIIPFSLPIITAKMINRSQKYWIRILRWISLAAVILAVIALTGRYFQDGLRNIH